MEKMEKIARLSLGGIFLLFGLNGFYLFIPVPEFHPFMEILVSSGYIYAIKSVEVLGGVLLLSNRFVPLGLAILTPDVVNILLYHVLLDPRNGWFAAVIAVLLVYLLWVYQAHFTCLLAARADVHQNR